MSECVGECVSSGLRVRVTVSVMDMVMVMVTVSVSVIDRVRVMFRLRFSRSKYLRPIASYINLRAVRNCVRPPL